MSEVRRGRLLSEWDELKIWIPIKTQLNKLADLRPIALRNGVYKIIAKAFSQQTKDVSEPQSAFIT